MPWQVPEEQVPITPPEKMEEILRCFAGEARHLTTMLNIAASDMIRDKSLVKKLDEDPGYFSKVYGLSHEEAGAMRERDLPALYRLGLHPFLLVRFAGMVGILEYWHKLGAPGRRDQGKPQEVGVVSRASEAGRARQS